MEEIKYWIWLSRIENVSPVILLGLLKKFKNPKEIWNLKEKDIVNLGQTKKVAEKITNNMYKQNIKKYIEYMQKNKIDIINYFDKDYPKMLKNIYDPPIALYIKGNRKILNDYGLAIVGCRECTAYGKYIAKKFAYNLGTNNINVISGLAKGIDSYAHIGNLQAKAKTIAVVGSGLDSVYPKENTYLFNDIISSNRSSNIRIYYWNKTDGSKFS